MFYKVFKVSDDHDIIDKNKLSMATVWTIVV